MTEWIKWNGGKCPVHPKTVVRVQLECESLKEANNPNDDADAFTWRWSYTGERGDIIAYKVIQEYQPTIAETIRDAAINWPQFLGDVECGILDAFGPNKFCGEGSYRDYLWCTKEDQFQARTFMLLVAEALE